MHGGLDLYFRIHQSRRTDNLFHPLTVRFCDFINGRCCRNVYSLIGQGLVLFKSKRSVIERGGQPKTIFNQCFLARPIAAIHAGELWQCGVTLVNNNERIFWQILHERRRRLTRLAAGQMAGIIFDALAVAHFFHHLQVEVGTLLQTLRFQQFVLFSVFSERQCQLRANVGNRSFQVFAGRNIMAAGINGRFINRAYFFAAQRINERHGFNCVAEKFYSQGLLVFIRRKYFHYVAAHTKRTAMKINVIAFILNFHQPV